MSRDPFNFPSSYHCAVSMNPTHQPQAGCKTRSIFKLNTEFKFRVSPSPKLVGLSGLKNTVCSIYSELVGGEKIHTFPKGIRAMWNTNSLIQSLNLGHQFHFFFFLHHICFLFVLYFKSFNSSVSSFEIFQSIFGTCSKSSKIYKSIHKCAAISIIV